MPHGSLLGWIKGLEGWQIIFRLRGFVNYIPFFWPYFLGIQLPPNVSDPRVFIYGIQGALQNCENGFCSLRFCGRGTILADSCNCEQRSRFVKRSVGNKLGNSTSDGPCPSTDDVFLAIAVFGCDPNILEIVIS
jgi:hypothetical protein